MARHTETQERLLGNILREMNLVTESQIQEALAVQREKGGALGAILVDLNYIMQDDLTLALATQSGMDVIEVEAMEIPEDLVRMVSPSIAQVYRLVPVSYEGGVLTVALADPTHLETLDDLRFLLGCEVKGAVSDPRGVDRAIDKYYGSREEVEDVLKELEETFAGSSLLTQTEESGSIELESLEEMAEAAPVRKLLNLILLQAIQDRSSDIHFEPFEDEFKIRYRVDGVLYEMVPPPRQLHLAISSRIKVMAQLDIAERRLPQDGRISLNISGNPVDLRVSTLPTMFGESVVLRVLDRRRVALDLDRLGLRADELRYIHSFMALPHGIVLLTGPTGCGKTTTLYSMLREMNTIDVKIITVEDPVEYDLEGIMQMQIREEAGVTFANTMRYLLRQDPDILLVGEIRDLETGQMAIQASLTGHLVLSTLHTNDAATALTRLVDLGMEPYLLCATVEGVVAERLVRQICPDCREEYEPSAESLFQIGLRPEDVTGKKFCRGRGCDMCNSIGYRGRTGIFEVMTMNEEIRELLMAGASTNEIRICARRHGCRSLREAGLLAIYDGLTTLEEIVRETLAE